MTILLKTLRLKLAILLLMFSASETYAVAYKDLLKYHIVQDCNILNMNGDLLKVFPGKMCLFFDDGSFVSATTKGMRLFGKDDSVVWEFPGYFHHQLALSPDKKRIFALSSDVAVVKGNKIRVDKILVISVDGKVLHELNSDVLLGMTKQDSLNWDNMPWVIEDTKTKTEMSHFNSLYEIPKIKSSKHPAFKEGNLILNGLSHGTYVMSPDLKKVLFHSRFNTSLDHRTHDAQVTENGNVIFFNNISSDSPRHNAFSSIQEFDPFKKEVVFEFTAQPKAMFYSLICGSVQEFGDDLILFSDRFNGTYIYSRKEKWMYATIRETHNRNNLSVSNQYTKAYDLSKFLARRK